MSRWIILLLCLLTSSPLWAQKKIERETYLIHVKPVISGIVRDFYQMISLFPDFPKNLSPLIEEVDNLNPEKEILKSSCPGHINKVCRKTLDVLRKKVIDLKILSLKLIYEKKTVPSLHVYPLSAQRIGGEFDALVEETKGIIDNASLLLAAGFSHKVETFQVLKRLIELENLLSLILVEHIPALYREDFRHFYFNFILPLQRQLSRNSNHEFVNRNLNPLNFSINLFNQTLTKKKKTPEGMGQPLSVIHMKWNSLLRYYF